MRLLRSTPVKFTLAIAGLALVLFLLIPWLVAGKLTAPVNHSIGQTPNDLPVEAVQYPSTSGALIHGWFIPGRKGAGAIILVHGVRSDRSSMLDRARFLSRADYSVLLFDFQAHGESPGRHITFGYLESMDATASINYLRSRAPDEKIGVIGVSMGGAAFLLASPQPEVQAVVLEMVYPTIDEAAADRIKIRLGSWSGVLSPLLSIQLRLRLGISSAQLPPIDHLAGLTQAKLFIVGGDDLHTPLAESRRMFETAPEPRQLWVVEGAPHTDLYKRTGPEYEHRVLEFFQGLRSSTKVHPLYTDASKAQSSTSLPLSTQCAFDRRLRQSVRSYPKSSWRW